MSEGWYFLIYLVIGLVVARIVYKLLDGEDELATVVPIFTVILWPLSLAIIIIFAGHKKK